MWNSDSEGWVFRPVGGYKSFAGAPIRPVGGYKSFAGAPIRPVRGYKSFEEAPIRPVRGYKSFEGAPIRPVRCLNNSILGLFVYLRGIFRFFRKDFNCTAWVSTFHKQERISEHLSIISNTHLLKHYKEYSSILSGIVFVLNGNIFYLIMITLEYYIADKYYS